ncbi:uncharacterized protein LOC134468506 [Engraulis encrasicolus]|uniref:uncharacterized protein LOC134468506 n=1 Tax=Engraulis encrasicolus TaxID=184585 RepID=UPI002FCFDE25
MEPGCFGKFGNFVRETFSSLLKRTRQRGVAEQRGNLSISTEQATPKVGSGSRRARLRASGWRTSREGLAPETELEEKLRATILELQEKRRGQRTWLRRREPRAKVSSNKQEEHVDLIMDPVTTEVPQETSKATSDTHCDDATGANKTNVQTCCPLWGKKAHSKMWEDTVLLGLGLGLTITSATQSSFDSRRQPGNLGMPVVPMRRVPVMGVKALYWRAKQMGVLIEGQDDIVTGRPIPCGFEDAVRAH